MALSAVLGKSAIEARQFVPCTTVIGLSVLDHLRIATDDDHVRAPGGAAKRLHLRLQHLGRRSGLDDQTAYERKRCRAGDRQIVDRSVYRQLADRSAGKSQRTHDEAVGRHRDPNVAHGQTRRIGERLAGAYERCNEPFDEAAARLAAGAVRHVDLCILERDRPAERNHDVARGVRASPRR